MATKRILIIDDEADIREIAHMSLKITNQWAVLTAASSQEGVAIAVAEQPDAILLDVVMPEVDGLATLKALHQNSATRNIPVILLTATVKIASQLEYQGLGVKAILTKPFDPGIFGSQIATALGWHEDR